MKMENIPLRQPEYIIFGRDHCEFCLKAIEWMEKEGFSFYYKSIYDEEWKDVLQTKTVPIILKVVGGYTDLVKEGYLSD